MISQQQRDTDIFYTLFDELSNRVGGPRKLKDCAASTGWPNRGVYFFFEDGEIRLDGSPRVVRIGTHAIAGSSKTTLWNRLANHRGTISGPKPGGGNHRGSIFREHVGTALVGSDDWPDAVGQSWCDKNANREARHEEFALEQAVTRHIGEMPFLWLPVPERRDRQMIERNSIGLLSRRRGGVDPASLQWLGLAAESEKVRTAALWNVHCVDEQYDPNFLSTLKQLIRS